MIAHRLPVEAGVNVPEGADIQPRLFHRSGRAEGLAKEWRRVVVIKAGVGFRQRLAVADPAPLPVGGFEQTHFPESGCAP
jgi:hypothetical protein